MEITEFVDSTYFLINWYAPAINLFVLNDILLSPQLMVLKLLATKTLYYQMLLIVIYQVLYQLGQWKLEAHCEIAL